MGPGKTRRGTAGPGMVRHGEARRGAAGPVLVRQGMAAARLGVVRKGKTRPVHAGLGSTGLGRILFEKACGNVMRLLD